MKKSLVVGDHVSLITRDGAAHTVKIIALEKDALVGEDASGTHRFAYAQIKRLETRKIDASKTTFAVLLGIAATIGIGAILVSHALDF